MKTLLILLALATNLNAQDIVKWNTLYTDGNLKIANLKKIEIDTAAIYLSSETHGIASNNIIKNVFFEYLYENYGVRNFLIEYAPSRAFLNNYFLINGDKDAYGKEIQKLVSFYRNLPANKKYRYWGIDFDIAKDRFPDYYKAIKLIIGDSLYKNILVSHKIIGEENEKNALKIDSVLNQLLVNDSAYLKKLIAKENWLDFKLILQSCKQFKKGWKRDYLIYQQYLKTELYFYENNEHVKRCFGQFGSDHIINSWKDNFYHLLKKDSLIVNKKIVRMANQYVNCRSDYYGDGKELEYYKSTRIISKKLNKAFLQETKPKIVIIDKGKVNLKHFDICTVSMNFK
jgi:hypothetical protein